MRLKATLHFPNFETSDAHVGSSQLPNEIDMNLDLYRFSDSVNAQLYNHWKLNSEKIVTVGIIDAVNGKWTTILIVHLLRFSPKKPQGD